MKNNKIICENCFKDINKKICPYCGHKNKKNNKEKLYTALWIIIPTIIALSIMFIAWFFVLNNNTNNPTSSTQSITPNINSESEIVVPNLTGLNFNELKQSFDESGEFKILLSSTEFSDTIQKGCIISQTPDKGTSVPRNSIIAVVISNGSKNKTLPDIAGLSLYDACQKLSSDGFIVKKVSKQSDTVIKGYVIGYENYSAGQILEYGSEIKILVSNGKN